MRQNVIGAIAIPGFSDIEGLGSMVAIFKYPQI
jgi:hypothetical protein